MQIVDLSHMALGDEEWALHEYDSLMRYQKVRFALDWLAMERDTVGAVTSSVVSTGGTVPRRRFQRGRLFHRGTKRRVWVLAFREDVPQPDGSIKRVQRKVVLGLVRAMSKAEAYTTAAPYLEAVNLTVAPKSGSGRSLRAFTAEWESGVAPTLKPSTVRAAKSHLRTHILPALGDLPLSAITTRNVQAFVSGMSTKGLSRKTIENVLQTLLSLLTTAKAWRYVFTVFDRSALSLPRDGERKDPRFFTAAQVQRIVAASEEPYGTLWAVLAVTGCRAGEILALQVGDLDFERGVIRIRRTLDGATRLTHAPKSRTSSADLPMPETLAKRLRRFLGPNGGWRSNSAGLLFCNSKGKPMQRDKVALRLQETLASLGIEKAALHAFRHMAASELIEGGAAPSVVQRQMRHSDARITLQRYSHVIGDAQRRAVEGLAQRVLVN